MPKATATITDNIKAVTNTINTNPIFLSIITLLATGNFFYFLPDFAKTMQGFSDSYMFYDYGRLINIYQMLLLKLWNIILITMKYISLWKGNKFHETKKSIR